MDFLAPQQDWLDVTFCAEDDDATFYRELPPPRCSGMCCGRCPAMTWSGVCGCRLVHKLGAGVNTIDVDTATRLGILVANMPGANAPSVAEGTVLLMLRRTAPVARARTAPRGTGTGWPSDHSLGGRNRA